MTPRHEPPQPDSPLRSGEPRTFNAEKFSSLVPAEVMARICIHVDGIEVFTNDDVDEWKTTWSSVCRTMNAFAWGVLFQDGKLKQDDLYRLVHDVFPASVPSRLKIEDHATLGQMLSTTIGGVFAYSDGDTWPVNHDIFAEFTGQRMEEFVNARIIPEFGGGMMAGANSDDGTVRIDGTCRDMVRFGDTLLARGRAQSGVQLVPTWFADLMIAGGTYGDDSPNPREGYQTHLWKDGTHSESATYENPDTGEKQSFHSPGVPNDAFFAYGGTDRAVIAVVPCYGLALARHNSNHGYPIDTFLEAACLSVEGEPPPPAANPCVIENYTYERWLELGKKIDARYRQVSGTQQPPAGTDVQHNTWRVLKEGMSEQEMLKKMDGTRR